MKTITPEEIQKQAVDQPILNPPYTEPSRHWQYENREPILQPGRRQAGYWFRSRRPRPGQRLTYRSLIA